MTHIHKFYTANSSKTTPSVRSSCTISNMLNLSANPCGGSWRYHSRQMCQAIISSQEDIPMIRSFFAKEDGQGLVEYALILVLIAIVVIGILTVLGGKVSQVFSSINSGLS